MILVPAVVPKTRFYVTETRFTKKIMPNQFLHVILWSTNEYVSCNLGEINLMKTDNKSILIPKHFNLTRNDIFQKWFGRNFQPRYLGNEKSLQRNFRVDSFSLSKYALFLGVGSLGSSCLPIFLNNSLMGSFGKGNLQKIFCRFPRTFRKLSAEFPDAIKRICVQISANFPQTFCKKPFANDPISELLNFLVYQTEWAQEQKTLE